MLSSQHLSTQWEGAPGRHHKHVNRAAETSLAHQSQAKQAVSIPLPVPKGGAPWCTEDKQSGTQQSRGATSPRFQQNKHSLFRHELHSYQETSPQDRTSAKTSPRPKDSTHGIKHQLLTHKMYEEKKVEPPNCANNRRFTTLRTRGSWSLKGPVSQADLRHLGLPAGAMCHGRRISSYELDKDTPRPEQQDKERP